MKLEAKARGAKTFDPFTTTDLGSRSQAEAIIVLSSFERELDALLSFMDESRNPAVAESIIRRYVVAEEIHDEITEATKRIDIKMKMVGTRIARGDE